MPGAAHPGECGGRPGGELLPLPLPHQAGRAVRRHLHGRGQPSAAVYLKERFSDLIPGRLEEILDYLARERQAVKETVPQSHRREALLKALFAACLDRGRPLTPGEREEICHSMEEDVL